MVGSRASVVSSFTIIKGSLIEPTWLAFQSWNPESTTGENLRRLQREDPVGASSANWMRDLRKVFHRRFDPATRDRPLMDLARADGGRPCAREIWKPILLFHMTRDEFLLRDFLSGWLFRQHEEGTWRLRVVDVLPYLADLHHRPEVQIKVRWSEETTRRVASGLLRMALDFGLMKGTVIREFVPYQLPDEAFLYVLHALAEHEPNARRIVEAQDWRMFLMSPGDVEQELFRLHQFQRLHYEVAGSVAELRLPFPTAADFCREGELRSSGGGGSPSPVKTEGIR